MAVTITRVYILVCSLGLFERIVSLLYFIDESGQDHGAAPYEVLAAVAVQESNLWNMIQRIRDAEMEFFGLKLSDAGVEFKGKRLLNRRGFRFAAQGVPIPDEERRTLARKFLIKGYKARLAKTRESPRRTEFTAYGQAVVAFIQKVFELMALNRMKPFAAIVDKMAQRPADKT